MRYTWRWFGPRDPVPLAWARQASIDIVTSALHDIYPGEEWPVEAIRQHKARIAEAGIEWVLVESLFVADSIKYAGPDRDSLIDKYCASIRNCAAAGIDLICYNFMPVVDWTRTDLLYPVGDGSSALRFDFVDFVAYDAFILKRPRAERDYPAKLLEQARQRAAAKSEQENAALEANVIAGLPGGHQRLDRETLLAAIARFDGVGPEQLRENLRYFLERVVPVAEESGVLLCIHPDDPPFSLFGLPRVVSTAEDIRFILSSAPSEANGLTYCSGSFGSRKDNDLVAMMREFAPKTYSIHLRNVAVEADGSFVESGHMKGDADMVALIGVIVEEETRRRKLGHRQPAIPMRADHGHLIGADAAIRSNPGYSFIGRLKGLAELRGAERALRDSAGAGAAS
jgi:mannonate dehydratase